MGRSFKCSTYLSDLLPSAPTLFQRPIPTAPKLMVCLYHFYTLKLSSPHEVLLEIFQPSIRALVTDKYPVHRYLLLVKPVRFTTNMAIYQKIKTPSSNISKYISLLIYARLETRTLKVKLRGYLPDPKKHIHKLLILQIYYIYK